MPTDEQIEIAAELFQRVKDVYWNLHYGSWPPIVKFAARMPTKEEASHVWLEAGHQFASTDYISVEPCTFGSFLEYWLSKHE